MCTRTGLSMAIWSGIGLAALAASESARADEFTQFATVVDVVDGWNWEQNAAGGPETRCHDQLYSSNCINNQSPPSRSTAILNASNFDTFHLPAGHVITYVGISVHGGWAANVSGDIRVIATNYPSSLPRARTLTIDQSCDWTPLFEITGLEPDGWTQAEVNALEVGVRRESGTAPATPLWNDAFRVVVRTQLQPPDLTIIGFSQSPANPAIGDDVTFTVTVQNNGPGPAGYFEVAFIDDSPAQPGDPCNSGDADFLEELPAGGAFTFEFFTSYDQPGPKRAWAFVDSCTHVAETNESNNVASRDITVAGPDLLIQSITLIPANPSLGEPVEVRVTVRNAGGAAAEFFELHLFENSASAPADPCDGDQSEIIDNLGPSTSATYVFDVQYDTLGGKRLWAFADACDDVSESNEENNSANRSVTVQAADLTICGMTVTPPDPWVGETVTITVMVCNQGNAVATDFDLTFFEDSTALPLDTCFSDDWETLASLAAGESVTLTFEVTYGEAGSKRAWAIADGCEGISEVYENNNALSRTFIVQEDSQPCLADLDEDGIVTVADLAILLASIGTTGGADYWDGDLDGDRDVDLQDLAMLLSRFALTCP